MTSRRSSTARALRCGPGITARKFAWRASAWPRPRARHSRHPRHFGALERATHTGEGYNPLCGDRVKIYLLVNDRNRIADIKFEGKGCAISQASASLMTDMLVGRSVDEAEQLMGGFLHL